MNTWRPQVVVISVGAHNPYGHPTEHALTLYQQEGAKIYRTDRQGTITVTAEKGGTYTVSPERGSPTQAPELAPLLPQRPNQHPGVSVKCVLYNPPGDDDGNESVTLYTTVTTNLTGWRLEDAAHHRFPLSGVIQAGQRYAVPNPGKPVWNNNGDTAYLYDASGELVDSFSYSGGNSQACR